jgi:hypothetical protein
MGSGSFFAFSHPLFLIAKNVANQNGGMVFFFLCDFIKHPFFPMTNPNSRFSDFSTSFGHRRGPWPLKMSLEAPKEEKTLCAKKV